MYRVIVASTRLPDEFWMVCETEEDVRVAEKALKDLLDVDALVARPKCLRIEHVPTPQTGESYDVIPYSHKINWVLDRSEADYFVYLDNGSLPEPEKYEVMARALDENPEYGVVYCGQHRTGMHDVEAHAEDIVGNPYGRLNFTQTMHRRTDRRWTLDLAHANPDLADGIFFRDMAQDLGDFYPVAPQKILDRHHIPDAAASHLKP
jgi:hypothetical protein